MLLLVFRIGGERYALETRHVREILPYTQLARLPQAPAWVAGVLDFRGEPVPVIDLHVLADGSRTDALMSTRVVMLDYPAGGPGRILGLLAEHATEVIKHAAADTRDTGVHIDDAPYLGEVFNEAGDMIRLIAPEGLLPEHVRGSLYTQAAEALAG